MSNDILNLVNKRIRRVYRAAAMGTIGFGDVVKIENKKYGMLDVPIYALHIQCSFRIRQGTNIIISNLDMFEPKEANVNYDEFDWDIFGNNLYDACAEKLNQMFDDNEIYVIAVDISEIFDLKITLSNKYIIEIFVNAPKDEEAWRFFGRECDGSHFVVERGQT